MQEEEKEGQLCGCGYARLTMRQRKDALDDTDPHPLVLWEVVLLGRLGSGVERGEHVRELGVSERDRLVKVLVLDRSRDSLRLSQSQSNIERKSARFGRDDEIEQDWTYELDGLGEGVPDNLVLDDSNHVRRRLGLGLEHGVDGLDSLEGGEDSVKRARDSSSLGVAEGGDSGVEPESVGEHVLDVVRLDRVQVPVERSLGDDDDRLSLSNLSVLSKAKREEQRAR